MNRNKVQLGHAHGQGVTHWRLDSLSLGERVRGSCQKFTCLTVALSPSLDLRVLPPRRGRGSGMGARGPHPIPLPEGEGKYTKHRAISQHTRLRSSRPHHTLQRLTDKLFTAQALRRNILHGMTFLWCGWCSCFAPPAAAWRMQGCGDRVPAVLNDRLGYGVTCIRCF